MFEAMLQGEMNGHIGYGSNDHGAKNTTNRRNGYTHKTLKSSMGEIEIDPPRDRDSSFDSQIISKNQPMLAVLNTKYYQCMLKE